MATGPSGDGRKEKSATAFRTISEVANDLELPQHVLRFWETKFQVIKPMKRGGGRRYYRPEDIDVLRRIRGLLYDEGYTIKGVQKVLRAGGGKEDPAPLAPVDPVSSPQKASFIDEDKRLQLKSVLKDLEELRESLQAS